MCEFCEKIQKDVPNWDFNYDEETDSLPSGDAIDLLSVHGYIALVFTNSADEYEYGHIKVNYFPMCGRDLRIDKIVVGKTETLEKYGIDLGGNKMNESLKQLNEKLEKMVKHLQNRE